MAQTRINVFLHTIKESWTWARLTEKERDNFTRQLLKPTILHTIVNCRDHSLSVLNDLYDTFLSALDYKDWHWRE